MMVTLSPRRPQHGDVTKIPTPPLQAAALFITFFFPALALVIFSLRVYIRVKMRQWGADDYCMCLAMLCSILMCGPFYLYIKLNYFGWRAVYVPSFDPSPGLWWFYVAQIFYNPVLAFVKASVLLFLRRIGGQKPGVRCAIWAIFTFNALQAIAIFLVAVLQCLPISANWDAEVRKNATCVKNSFHISISCLTIFTDILVLALPFWIFLGLKMRTAQKAAVIGVFMVGLAVTIVGVVRLRDMYNFLYKPPPPDPYHNIGITLNTVEVNLAIICASIPPLRPLVRSWFPSLFDGSSAKPYGSSRKYTFGYGERGAVQSVLQRSGTIGGGGGGGTRGSIALKHISGRGTQAHTECRSVSPHGSEEEIMTYHGIMKSTQVHVHFDGRTTGTRDGDGDGDGSAYEFGHASRVSSDTEGEKKIGRAGL